MVTIIDSTEQLAKVARTVDDVRAIRQDCKTVAQWQEQLLISLTDSGWILDMLSRLPAASASHWFQLLFAERMQRWAVLDIAFERITPEASEALAAYGDCREEWLLLALRCLVERGWTRTMLAEAFRIPRTNIIRRLQRCGVDTADDEDEGSDLLENVRTGRKRGDRGDFCEISEEKFRHTSAASDEGSSVASRPRTVSVVRSAAQAVR